MLNFQDSQNVHFDLKRTRLTLTVSASACVRVRLSQVKGFEKMAWMSDASAQPPWLRFHLGISRWELYDRKDPNLTLLTHHLATQRILGAGEQWRGKGWSSTVARADFSKQ